MARYPKEAVKAAARYILADANDEPIGPSIAAFKKLAKENGAQAVDLYSTWVIAARHIGADPYGTIMAAADRAKKVLKDTQ
jgi:hypothetical protein